MSGIDQVERSPGTPTRNGVLPARLLIGLIVIICAEVFSGASLQAGLWSPWTWLVTYGLYFAHFFFFTTIAVWTARTSLSALYLFGVLFGLYESWITKVIWAGYSGDGKFALGKLGPYGYSEISMVFFYHPVASFILPLAVACLLFPSIRGNFPGLEWLTADKRHARWVRAYLAASFAMTMAFNSGGPRNLALNLLVVAILLAVLLRLARPAMRDDAGTAIVAFGRPGFVGLCAYLALLYGTTYPLLRYESLPSISLQLFTFVFYAFAIAGLWIQCPSPMTERVTLEARKDELRRVARLFAIIVLAALLISFGAKWPGAFVPVAVNLAIWTPLGLFLTALAALHGLRGAHGNSNNQPQRAP